MMPIVEIVALLILSLSVNSVKAQTLSPNNTLVYPSKAVRYIVPYAPGGGTDILARTIGAKLTEQLGQPFVIDNRPGAGGNLATENLLKAPPDGYTILAGNVGPIAVNPSLYKLTFDPQRELSGVSLLALAPLLIVTHPALPVKRLQDLIVLAKRAPGTINYSSAGIGSSNHLAGALFDMLTHVHTIHVPYRGAGPAMTDLIAGHVMLAFVTLPSSMSFVKTGRLNILAISSAHRSPLLPQVPTTIESGLPEHQVSAWYSVVVRAGTSRAMIDKLNASLIRALQYPDVKDKLSAEGAMVMGNSPEEFSAFIKSETTKWASVVTASGMKAE